MLWVAKQLGYGVESVRGWVVQADIDEGKAPGVTTDEAKRIAQLEQENRELRRANEILKRAAHSRPPIQKVASCIDANRDAVVEGRPLGVEPIGQVSI